MLPGAFSFSSFLPLAKGFKLTLCFSSKSSPDIPQDDENLFGVLNPWVQGRCSQGGGGGTGMGVGRLDLLVLDLWQVLG